MKKRLMTVLVMLTLMICVLPMVVSADECNHSWNNYQGICGACREQHAHDNCWSGSCSICGYDVSWQHPDYYPVDEHCDACGGCLDANNQSWDSDNHWYVCNQNHIVDQKAHNIVDGACKGCDYEIPHEHSWSYTEIPTTGTHTKSCGCGVSETETCTGCDVTDCSKCGSGLLGIHPDNDNEGHCDFCEECLSPSWTLKYNSTQHWYECTCGEQYEKEEHTYNANCACECGAIGHTYTTYIYNDDATCTGDGTETAACDNNCGEKVTRSKAGSALDHDWDDGEVTTKPTYTAKGEMVYSCRREGCDETMTVELDKLQAPATPGTAGLDYVPKTGSVLIEWLYTLIFG